VNAYLEDRKEQGFTLIELLIAIVVVGILAAVAIVGIAGLTNTGGKSACTATKDATHAASAAYYSNQNPNAWPTDFVVMTTGTNPVLELQEGAHVDWDATTNPTGSKTKIDGNGWTLTGNFSAGATPDFTQSATNGCH